MQPPIIPFYPVVKKDLTFIHLANDTNGKDGLVNFEKLRMIAKEVSWTLLFIMTQIILLTWESRGSIQ